MRVKRKVENIHMHLYIARAHAQKSHMLRACMRVRVCVCVKYYRCKQYSRHLS